jgi:hypothetical protein
MSEFTKAATATKPAEPEKTRKEFPWFRRATGRWAKKMQQKRRSCGDERG